MHRTLKDFQSSALLATCLGLGVATPLALLNTACATPSKDKASSTHANISSFLVANSLAPTFPTTSTAKNALDVTVGDRPWLVPNFANTGGSATITPTLSGNPPIVSGVPLQVDPVSQAGDTVYTLTVTDGSGHSVSQTATITAWAAPNATITADASAVSLTAGLTASVADVPGCTYSWTPKQGGAIITSATNGPTITYTAGPVGTMVLQCTVTNKAGATDTETVTIPVQAHPPAGFTYPMGTRAATFYKNVPISTQIPNLAPGDPFTSFSVSPALPAGLSLDPSTGVISGTPSAQAALGSYVVTGTNTGGSSTYTLTFQVNAQPAIAFYASPAEIGLGGGTILSWIADATVASITVDNGLQTLPLDTTTLKNGSFNVAPASDTTYTITASLVGGGSVTSTATVTVDPTPLSLNAFTADSTQVTFGGGTILRWSLTGTPTALTLNGASVMGTTSDTVFPSRRQTYTLAGSNGTGGANAVSGTVTVAARGLDLLAGNIVSGGGSQDGTGTSAQFNGICAMAMDANHNLYAADQKNDTIRKITPAGVVTTIAGSPGVAKSVDNADATKATFAVPTGIAVSPAGNIFVVDNASGALRIIRHGGGTLTVTGTPNWSSAYSVAVASDDDATAVVYVGTSATSGAVYKLSIALSPTAAVATPLNNWSTNLGKIYGLTYVPATSTLYMADDGKDVIRTIVADSATVNVVAGTSGSYGNRDGATTSALFNYPVAVAVDASGTMYVADEGNNTVRKISGGQVVTIGGAATNTSSSSTKPSTPGATNGPGASATFRGPMGIALDGNTLYVSESYFTGGMANNDIRAINVADPTYPVTTFAGSTPQFGTADGAGAAAAFNSPFAMAVDANRNTYVTDTGNHTIRKIAPDGTVTTIAGTAGTSGSTEAPALFKSPQGIAVDAAGNLYVADTGNHTIRMLTWNASTSSYACSTIAGTVSASGGFADGAAAQFKSPRGLAVNAAGTMIFVADSSNHRVRMLTLAGGAWTASTLAGTGTATAGGDMSAKPPAPGTTATLSTPYAVAYDGGSNLYVAEYGGDVIKQITLGPSGAFTAAGSTVAQIAGKGSGAGFYGFADGALGTSMFNYPQGIALDAAGNLWVADQGNNAIRKLTLANGAWTVTTGVGAAAPGGATGTLPGALPGTLWSPQSVAITPDGDLVVTTNGGVAQVTAP